jgi:hypothetical protein
MVEFAAMKRASIFFLLLTASSAAAQKQPIAPDSCLYTIPSSAFKRVPVFLEATKQDSASRAILPSADFFTQAVAFRIRELLGAKDSKLVEADSAINWSTLWGEVVVAVKKDAPITWSVKEWSGRADSSERSSLRILRRAIADVVANGETVVLPDGLGDSATFGMSFVNPRVTKEGKVIPVKARQAVPVFTLLIPWDKSVELTKFPDVKYPEISRSLGAIGSVQLAFFVDKSGRADVSSIKELWPSDRKRPSGEALLAYEAFLRAVKRDLPSARFSPAVIGGCVMKQMVNQTFEFKIP